tara:strand:+ start:796 stop:1050 length:255 start_codon:yes stop_codon:yes gene_type:complete
VPKNKLGFWNEDNNNATRGDDNMLLEKLKAIGVFIMFVLAIHLIMLVFIEFMAGCGTKTYYNDGTWETMPCVFIPYETTTGTWR